MANRGYDVVVDVDTEVLLPHASPLPRTGVLTASQGDLGHTDLQDDDLEFHSSSQQLFSKLLSSSLLTRQT